MRSDIFTLAFHKIWNLGTIPTSYIILGLFGRNVLLGGLSLYHAMGVAVVLCRARVVGLHETGRED